MLWKGVLPSSGLDNLVLGVRDFLADCVGVLGQCWHDVAESRSGQCVSRGGCRYCSAAADDLQVAVPGSGRSG